MPGRVTRSRAAWTGAWHADYVPFTGAWAQQYVVGAGNAGHSGVSWRNFAKTVCKMQNVIVNVNHSEVIRPFLCTKQTPQTNAD